MSTDGSNSAGETLMIGVSGMRGTIGGSLTPATVYRMAAAFATWLWDTRNGGTAPTVVMGRDSRPSGPFVRDAAASALEAAGVELIDLGVVTTPGVAMMVGHLEADAGIVITASHNPIEWNGLKFLNCRAVAPPADAVADIRRRYDASEERLVQVETLVAPSQNTQTHAYQVKRVLDRVDVLGVSTKAFKVVVDSVNGAGCVTSATMLSKLGCRLVHLNATPDGRFPHEPEPTEKNLAQLCQEVRRQKAAVGFAQDPDADRLAVVDENGIYIGEEYTLALCAMHIMHKKPGTIAATNLSTSRMIDDIAAKHGGRVLRTPVGEANVIDAMLQNDSIIGGEGNGGVIDPRIVPGRDSLVGMAYILQLMAETGKRVSELVAEIPRYVILKDKFETPREDANRAVEAVARHFGFAGGDARIDTQDGVRIDWADTWVSARPSNTEPIMRIIAEAPEEKLAGQRIDQVRRIVDEALGR